jgi:hypothetical protein
MRRCCMGQSAMLSMQMTGRERILPMRRPAVAAFCMDILRNEGPSAFYKGKDGIEVA